MTLQDHTHPSRRKFRSSLGRDDAVELEALRLWNERELRFPAFARLSWASGSSMARDIMRDQAESALRVKGRTT